MKIAMPPRITNAPTTIAIALPLLSPLLPDELVVTLVIVGVAVVVTLGVLCGMPGDSGLPIPWARAAGAQPSAQPTMTVASAPKPAVDERLPNTYRSDASGSSMAGVSGASRYGCSGSTSSS